MLEATRQKPLVLPENTCCKHCFFWISKPGYQVVLKLGESSAGSKLLARLRENSNRSRAPYFPLNCPYFHDRLTNCDLKFSRAQPGALGEEEQPGGKGLLLHRTYLRSGKC